MTLQPGQMLSHYRLVEKIGEGGMGVVWKADDTKLGRQVAIKILPVEFAKDRQRLARFEREAKLLAALNHPNIAAIHGLGESDGLHFLVLELVLGQSLAERLGAGPMPMDEALPVLLQIAEGLEAAHDRGVIHRDLKPSNIRLTPDGQPKILDFGLAKALEGAPESLSPEPGFDVSASPTLSAPATQRGVILGTAAYMSPEQARGRPVDRRADIWAYGCVAYEVLTGRRLFTGETISDMLAAVLRAEVDLDSLPRTTDRSIRDLLRRCLVRDHRRRLRDIGEARLALQNTLSGSPEELQATTQSTRLSLARQIFLIAAGAVLGVVAATLIPRDPAMQISSVGAPLRKFQFSVNESESNPVISPDGTMVAYVSGGRLWLRDLDQWESREISGSEDGYAPFWSPDSYWVAFAAGNALWKAPARGGERRKICDLDERISPEAGGAAWGMDGRVVFTTGGTGLLSVSAQGGDPISMLRPEPDEMAFHDPSPLPGGRGYLFVVHTKEGANLLALFDGQIRTNIFQLQSGEGMRLPVYSPTGHVLYRRRGTTAGIWALPFSVENPGFWDDPFLVEPRGRSPSVSSDGTLVYRKALPALGRLAIVDREGQVKTAIETPDEEPLWPAFSPDGTRIAYTGDRTIWIRDVAGESRMRIAFEDGWQGIAVWSPDGGELAYGTYPSSGPPRSAILLKASDGSGDGRVLAEGGIPAGSFSPDGRFFAYTTFRETGGWDLAYVPVRGDGEPVSLVATPADEMYPRVSPDGRYVAYQSDESDVPEIYLTRFPSGEGKWQVSVNGGHFPRWGKSGRRLFYLEGQELMEVQVEIDQSPRFETPRKLFTLEPAGVSLLEGFSEGFDVAGDGEQFLVVQSTRPGGELSKIAVVQNWFAEFKERR